MEKLIHGKLFEAHLNFPSYGERNSADLETLARMFARDLGDENPEDVGAAFDYHRRTADRFPIAADITRILTPVTLYQFDNGPEGFGALYAESHTYVDLQRRLGTSNYDAARRKVRPIDGVDIRQKRLAAKSAEYIRIDNSAEDPAPRAGGSGFRQIDWRPGARPQ